MKKREISFSKRVHASLRHYNLRFNKVADDDPKKGYANIIAVNDEVVEGALYDISDQDLPKLDMHEGYPKHYDKIMVKVFLDDHSQVEVVVYIAQPDKVKEGLKPTRKYLNHLLKAKDILSKAYFQKLKSVETLD